MTFLQDRRILKNGMLWGFLLLFVFFSIRYEYGNDYIPYRDVFNDVSLYKWNELSYHTKYVEIGWLVLCKLFQPFGFQSIIVFHTAFVLGVFYYLVNKYVPNGWKWFAVFFLLFNSSIMIIYLSMLRQSLSICLFLLGVNAGLEKRILYSIIFTILAISLHTSAIVIVPFVLISIVFSKKTIGLAAAFGLIFMLVLIFDQQIANHLLNYVMLNELLEDKYSMHIQSAGIGSGLGVLLQAMFFSTVLYDYKKYNRDDLILFLLFFTYLIIFPFGYVSALFTRIQYYFIVVGVLFLPRGMKLSKSNVLKAMVIAIVMFFCLYNYFLFFMSKTFHDSFYTYHTIFS